MLSLSISTGTLLLVSLVLALVALFALGEIIKTRRRVLEIARIAAARAQTMRELLRTVRMAETIACIGVWQYDPATGVQQWSNGLKRLFGIDEDEEFVEGDAETLLFAHNIDLIEKIKTFENEVEPFTLQFEIVGFDNHPRSIAVTACNLMSHDGSLHRVVAVVRDNTEQMRKVRELESSRARAMNEAQRARALAETDPLTGLANRRRVMTVLDRLVIDARVTEMPLVLVLFDIDHFKQVNDTHGHPAGDEVLRKVATLAKAQARGSDLVGRVGGEEFVWVIPAASESMARIMTERLRRTVAGNSATQDVPAVTISLGYTAMQAGDTALSMFARADEALYEAKHSGRNRVRMAA